MNSRMCFALLIGFACASIASAQSAVLPDAPLVPATGPAAGKPPEVARLLRQLAQARTLVENALDFSQSMQVENLRLRGETAKLRKALADQRDLTARLQRVEDQLRIEMSRLQIQIASLRCGRPSPAVIPVFDPVRNNPLAASPGKLKQGTPPSCSILTVSVHCLLSVIRLQTIGFFCCWLTAAISLAMLSVSTKKGVTISSGGGG